MLRQLEAATGRIVSQVSVQWVRPNRSVVLVTADGLHVHQGQAPKLPSWDMGSNPNSKPGMRLVDWKPLL